MKWHRSVGVILGFSIWVFIDSIRGEPYNPEMALLAGFVAAWIAE